MRTVSENTKSKTAQTFFYCQVVLKNIQSVDLQYSMLNSNLKFNIKPTISFQDN